MSIAALSPMPAAMIVSRPPEAIEGPGPDHDGDADNKSVGASSGTPTSPPPPGTGAVVDTKA